MLKSNDDGNAYFVGDSVRKNIVTTIRLTLSATVFCFQITWADLAVMNAWHWIAGFKVYPKVHLYPKLDAHRQKIEAHPRIQDWLERRPITPV